VTQPVNVLTRPWSVMVDEARRRGVVVLHLWPSRDQVQRRPAGTPGALSMSLPVVDRTMLPRRRANESQPSRCDIFPTGHDQFYGDQGTRQGVTGARRGLRQEETAQEDDEGRGKKERKKVVGKAVGDECSFIPGEGLGRSLKITSHFHRLGNADGGC
jgi:hypothetical protein